LAVIWTTLATLIILALRKDACLRYKTFSMTAAGAYLFSSYSEIQFYLHGFGQSPLQRQVRLTASLLASGAVVAFLLAELKKPSSSTSSQDHDNDGAEGETYNLISNSRFRAASPLMPSALREALLSADHNGGAENGTSDVEAGGDTATGGPNTKKRQRNRSWVSLVGIAARYMWPTEVTLQLRAAVCVFLIVALRLLNLAVPITYKKVIDEFSNLTSLTHPQDPGEEPKGPFPFSTTFYPWVFTWLVLYFLQGGGGGGGAVGLLSNIRSFLWIPIGQASFRRASLDIFTHVLSMDHHFHLHRKTGELLRIMDRGTASIQTLLGTVMFQIGPAIFDIAAAAAFLAVRLKAWIAGIVFTTLGMYIPMTIALTEWRGAFRRDLNQLDNARGARATDALLNYETVKLFGNEKLEEKQYAAAIDAYQKVDFKLSASMNALNVAQSVVIFFGMAAGMVVCTAGIADGSLTVGDAVLFVTLMQQLYAPLNFFGTYYRMIQAAMLDMEGVFDLLSTKPTVQDFTTAGPLLPPENDEYDIEFKDIQFQYADGAPVLCGVSFKAPAGGTTALVGATGSGKSSLLRLLLRFYDPQEGAVLIGGQDIRSVTQASLRACIAVVPQDTVLFNDTIKYNIRYGNPDASDEEIEAAAKGACIHETIMDRFPLGYDTLVGERGLRLSGGEKQRVAFARAILKNPAILVLDEATSALDSITERRIQNTLAETRRGRTVVVVAHRLSTIMDADCIVVMERGEVKEMGTHNDLIEREDGGYAAMWARQAESHTGGASSRAASSAALVTMASTAAVDEAEGKSTSLVLLDTTSTVKKE
jgi:ATP-binding cassette subfamily B (MDR/TAP) protein 6